jgi:hypothetical protein
MNWLAIIIATVVNMVLGSLWFSPVLFQKRWMALRVGAGASSLGGGAIIGLYCGLGFVAPAILSDHLFNERPPMLYLIVGGFPIVALLLMGAIIGALGA